MNGERTMTGTMRLQRRKELLRALYERLEALVDYPSLYNLLQVLISAGQRSTKRWAHEWLAVQPGERLLDVCCGTGEFCQLWTARDGLDYLGVDVNPRYIAYAKSRYGNAGRRAFRVEDATKLDLPDNSYDKILFANAFHHLPDDLNHAILRQLAAVLKPGGRLVFIDTVGDHQGRVQRFFLERDRGSHLRSLDNQVRLISDYFMVERSGTFDTGLTPQTIVAATKRPCETSATRP